MKKATWIWYPSDFEIQLANRCMTRRYERDVFIPPFWHLSDCYRNVKFSRTFRLQQADDIEFRWEGNINLLVNGQYVYQFDGVLHLEAGEYELVVSVYHDCGLPCLWVQGRELVSDADWRVTCNDHVYVGVGTQEFINPLSTPNDVRLQTEVLEPVRTFSREGKTVYDFDREIMASLMIETEGAGELTVSYGESVEEATDSAHCELCDRIGSEGGLVRTKIEKAFRYVVVEGEAKITGIRAENQFLPLTLRGNFTCSDERINQIYQTSLYTLHLNMREFLLDGIKRDRWIWSGDAYQGYLMNYYSYFDRPIVHRTMIALFGKPPVRTYPNHIMDYSFYWIMGLYDYYVYTGDLKFVASQMDHLLEMMEFCIARTNENGLMNGREEDWVFVDWADLDNTGEVCFEQMLFAISLRATEALCRLFARNAEAERYRVRKEDVLEKLEKFWDEEKGGYLYSYKQGRPDGVITKHANMFAVLYGLCDDARKDRIRDCVLKNPAVPAITTPYMRFYELAALCEVGEYEYVLNEISSYWGGMLDEGATTFWETYDKRERGAEKYAMYGRKYGKSLCHTWGASPVYLLGKYFTGVRPVSGKEYDFELRPHLGSLSRFEANVAVKEGQVRVTADRKGLTVVSEGVSGLLRLQGDRPLRGAQRKFDGEETSVFIGKDSTVHLEWEEN